MTEQENVLPLLARALQRIRLTPPRIISSPPTQPRRAAVALLIRVVPAPNTPLPPTQEKPLDLDKFFTQEWVNHPNATPEILFLHRETPTPATSDGSLWQSQKKANEAHIAFPGGRQEPDDEGGLYTAMRQTWEEIGIDLAEPCYTCVGQLDDREITTSLGKRLLMILSPFVFLQLTPSAPPADPVETTILHWTPLQELVSQHKPPIWSTVTVDAASRLASKHSAVLRLLVRVFIGSMQFPAIVFRDFGVKPTDEKRESRQPSKVLKLWGLSLGMTLDLMSYMILQPPPPISRNSSSTHVPSAVASAGNGNVNGSAQPDYFARPSSASPTPSTPLSEVMQLPYLDGQDFRMEYVAPSLASVFPRFSYPDVNFWIWVFGKRYREVIRGWEASVRGGSANDRRINWSGTALSTFYASIRKALVVVIVARALGVIFGVSFALWWIFS
ncbi:hypothetical protein CPB83DRAFT_912535 [Crepidotus variabilis]|uniref:Nudix hydrolase domain-containing protein n=1 Tax=Crepidotus variabilis TaxID=179855 RepID=A0A9P6EUA5_9AGAR|nr:hypothetical protein CPB83DRAFT_912535 [Crepidotus variabilis]